MKVLHLVKTNIGGIWAARQIEVLRSLGVEVTVALPSLSGPMVSRYRDAGARIVVADIDLTLKKPWLLPGRLRLLRRLVDEVKPDLIHSHFLGTTYMMRLALGRNHPIPRIFQVAGTLHLEKPPFNWLDIHGAGPSDRWIATCAWTRDAYLRAGMAGRVFFSYYGTDTEVFSPGKTGRFRAELGIPDDRPLVGMIAYAYAPKYFLGHIRGFKGHEDFIDAVQILSARGVDFAPVVVGGPWAGADAYFERLKARARRRPPEIVFTGTRSDVPELVRDFDLVVVPSLFENLGGVAEPLLSEVPVVGTNVGGIPDLVHHGETGWLVPPRSPEALADAISDALARPEEARRRARAGRQLCLSLIDWRVTGVEVKEIYDRILGEKGFAG